MSTAPAAAESTPAAAPAPAAAQPLTLAASLGVALSALRGKAPAALTAAEARVTQLEASLATLTQERDSARAERDTALTPVAAYFGIKPADLAGKDAAAVAALFDQRVSAAAVQQLAAAHIPLAELPKPVAADGATKALTHDEFNRLSPVARMEFVRSGGRLTTINLIGSN